MIRPDLSSLFSTVPKVSLPGREGSHKMLCAKKKKKPRPVLDNSVFFSCYSPCFIGGGLPSVTRLGSHASNIWQVSGANHLHPSNTGATQIGINPAQFSPGNLVNPHSERSYLAWDEINQKINDASWSSKGFLHGPYKATLSESWWKAERAKSSLSCLFVDIVGNHGHSVMMLIFYSHYCIVVQIISDLGKSLGPRHPLTHFGGIIRPHSPPVSIDLLWRGEMAALFI